MLICVSLALGLGGCGKTQKPAPDYAEALEIYNAETEALDRLTAQREALRLELEAPQPQELAEQALGQAIELGGELSGALKDLSGPEGAQAAEEATQKQDELLASVEQRLTDAKTRGAARKSEISTRIAALDQQIAEQQKRVDRARADRDAAEAARK
jgi:hypothetical protein